jgi:hypothetical protein
MDAATEKLLKSSDEHQKREIHTINTSPCSHTASAEI